VTISSIQLGLQLGPGIPIPAPGPVMRALRGVEVTQSDTAPCGFQLTFHTEQAGVLLGDFLLTDNPLLAPFSRVIVRVAVDGIPHTLIDGFITHQQYLPSNGPEDSVLVVTGEDISVKMDLIDEPREYPSMPDDMIVAEILAPWLALGIEPLIIPTTTSLVPFGYVPQQSGTDRSVLQELAVRNGNVFFVTPTPVPGMNVAYWGPPPRLQPPTAVLNVAVGSASDVDRFQAEFDVLKPQTFLGFVMQAEVPPYEPVPVVTLMGERFPPLAAFPALIPGDDLLLEGRRATWQRDDLDPLQAAVAAQAMTDRSTDEVVTVACDVTTERIGSIVQAPGVVGVRGTGLAYDGLYYLKSATHRITLFSDEQWGYTQSLTLTREGVGTTTPVLKAVSL
jgi:hypothetical protein